MALIRRIDNGSRGFYEATVDGEKAGKMTFHWLDDTTLIIDHTGVNEAYNGLGIGRQLVMAAIEYARENDIFIIPHCPYAKSLFRKMEEIQDVLYPDFKL